MVAALAALALLASPVLEANMMIYAFEVLYRLQARMMMIHDPPPCLLSRDATPRVLSLPRKHVSA